MIFLIKRIRKLFIVVLFIAIIQSVFTREGEVLIRLLGKSILTDYGLLRAAEFILRMGIIILSSIILSTSSSREILQAFIQLKIPYEIVFMVTTSVRFLPIFRDEIINMFIAIQLRGLDFKKIKLGKKLRVYRYLLLPIVLNSIIKAKELSIAMEMRGFRAYSTRTSFRQLKLNLKDYLVMGTTLLVATIFVALG